MSSDLANGSHSAAAATSRDRGLNPHVPEIGRGGAIAGLLDEEKGHHRHWLGWQRPDAARGARPPQPPSRLQERVLPHLVSPQRMLPGYRLPSHRILPFNERVRLMEEEEMKQIRKVCAQQRNVVALKSESDRILGKTVTGNRGAASTERAPLNKNGQCIGDYVTSTDNRINDCGDYDGDYARGSNLSYSSVEDGDGEEGAAKKSRPAQPDWLSIRFRLKMAIHMTVFLTVISLIAEAFVFAVASMLVYICRFSSNASSFIGWIQEWSDSSMGENVTSFGLALLVLGLDLWFVRLVASVGCVSPTLSMYPTFDVADAFIMEKVTMRFRPFSRRQVVLFKPPDAFRDLMTKIGHAGDLRLVKRIVAVEVSA